MSKRLHTFLLALWVAGALSGPAMAQNVNGNVIPPGATIPYQTIIIAQPGLVTTNTIGNPTVPGSIGQGAIFASATRTGGYGEYGHILCYLAVTAALPSPQIDNCTTNWMVEENLTGGASYGSWNGSITPSRGLGETYTSGAVVAQENDAGNRWFDFGLQSDVGGTRYTVGTIEAPDPTPAPDGIDVYPVTMTCPASTPSVFTWTANGLSANIGMTIYDGTPCTGFTPGFTYYVVNATTNTFELSLSIGGTPINGSGSASNVRILPSWPGSFAHVMAHSIHGHQWWVGELTRIDTIVQNGITHLDHGGSQPSSAPGAWAVLDGNYRDGLDMSQAAFLNFDAIKMNQYDGIVGGFYQGTATTPSTAPGNGALMTAGGLGVAGNGNFGGYIDTASGTLPTLTAGNLAIAGLSSTIALNATSEAQVNITASAGLVLAGWGSSFDVAILNHLGNVALGVFPGTTTVAMQGAIVAPNLPTTGVGGGIYLCVDTSGNVYKKASCP